MWTCCCFNSSESGSARQAWQRSVVESSTLVSKTGITSSYVLRGFHAQYDHSFGALQVCFVLSVRLVCLEHGGKLRHLPHRRLFSYILNRNPFHKLATLDISFNDQGGVSGRVPLTSATIRRLLQCDQLRELRISDWSVTDEEFAQLEEMVKTNNWELFLTRKLVSS